MTPAYTGELNHLRNGIDAYLRSGSEQNLERVELLAVAFLIVADSPIATGLAEHVRRPFPEVFREWAADLEARYTEAAK